jgi:hypothetical protein
MSFVIDSPPAETPEAEIAGGSFWPSIDPAAIREAYRIDTTVTPARLRETLVEAMASVNTELAARRIIWQTAGDATLADVPAEKIDGTSVLVHRYRRAVGCLAKALLIERMPDYDTTPAGERRADRLSDPIDDLRRDARWAISDILGVGRTTVELI